MPIGKWEIEGDPAELPRAGIDAKRWRWWVKSQDTGLVVPVIVKVSGTAMAVAAQHLPDVTRAARETLGRTEVEKVLDWWEPPRVIELHTASIEANRVGGAEQTPEQLGPETERRLRELEEWFDSQGLVLDFDQQTDGTWFALVSRKDQAVGAGLIGAGTTRVDAAEDAARALQPRERVALQPPSTSS